jgi:hypothetical protein
MTINFILLLDFTRSSDEIPTKALNSDLGGDLIIDFFLDAASNYSVKRFDVAIVVLLHAWSKYHGRRKK